MKNNDIGTQPQLSINILNLFKIMHKNSPNDIKNIFSFHTVWINFLILYDLSIYYSNTLSLVSIINTSSVNIVDKFHTIAQSLTCNPQSTVNRHEPRQADFRLRVSNQTRSMEHFDERSAYPKPLDFEVMRPEYEVDDDGSVSATITVSPFVVNGTSATEPGARRAAIYEAHKKYKDYHPSYEIPSPFPDEFTEENGTQWKRLSPMALSIRGDYAFVDSDGEEDYAKIEQMLMWDVRPASSDE